MASSGMSNLLKFGALAGAGYLAWEWWQGNQAASPAPASSQPSGTPAAGASSSGSSSGAASKPAYSGPSLDTIYSQLVAAVAAGMQGGDTAVSCPSGMGAIVRSGVPTRQVLSTDPVSVGRTPARIGSSPGSRAAAIAAGAATPPAPTSCSAPTATWDVWNWYLVNKTQAGLTSGPSSSDAGIDPSVQLTGAQFWAAASPLVSKSLGMSGLGAFGRAFRRGMGLVQGPPAIDPSGNLIDTTAADLAAAQASALQGGFDTNTGSYSVDPTTGAVTFTAPTAVPSKSIIPNVSNGALALGLGAGVLLLGVASGGRGR